MLLGLKRDLRKQEEGVVYPQEVSCNQEYSRRKDNCLV